MTRRSKWIPGMAFLLGAALVGLGKPAAQETGVEAMIDGAEREAVVTRIADLLEQNYVYADVGQQCGADLVSRLQAGEFDDALAAGEFATRLTDALQAVSHDKHLRVRVRPPARAQVERDDPALARQQAAARSRGQNYGFRRVEVLDGNIGYVDMAYFDGSPAAKPTAAAAMSFIAHADAVIFDMRRNGGGSPEMIRYLSSWFFAEPTHLNSLYWRQGNRTQEFWTYEEVPGVPRPEVPIFVLTSSRTFSGAEEFSYNMLTQKRGILIGEVTGGGANPGGMQPVNERFEVFIPVGAAVNPITGTNWEGVGVTPDIQVPADEAMDLALEKARVAAEEFRSMAAAGRELE